VPRFQLIPVLTGDGRRIVLQAVPLSAGDRARRLLDRLRGRRGRGR
jgi:hypothetical protein